MRTRNLAAANRLSGTHQVENAGGFAEDWPAQRSGCAQREFTSISMIGSVRSFSEPGSKQPVRRYSSDLDENFREWN
jgi:hypothetical protein